MVDPERCLRCGICVDTCPEGALRLEETLVVDTRRCTGCGACLPECPQEALSLVGQIEAPARGDRA